MIGYVYKIIHQTDEKVLPYIGSTVQKLSKRMGKHRSHYKEWKSGKPSKCMIFDNFEKYGIENFIIIELGRYEVLDKQELKKFEQDWIDETICCNKNYAYGRDSEKRKISNQRHNQTENRKTYSKLYKKTEKYKQQQKQYNKQKKAELVECKTCNIELTRGAWWNHNKTQTHKLNESIYYFSILPQL